MYYRIAIALVLILLGQQIKAQHQNVIINDIYNPNEPSVALDFKNPLRMMVGNNTSMYHSSEDGGLTWQVGVLESPLGVWGDPCLVTDTLGNFYFFHLSNVPHGTWIDRIVCQRSSDMGATWTEGSGIGLIPGKQQDKEWAVVNPINNEIYVTWTQFDIYGSLNPNDSSIIRFSKSSDLGLTWSEPVRLSQTAGNCFDNDQTVEGAVPTVGPEGQIYTSWSGPVGIMFDRSLDGGNTWLENDIPVDPQPGGWDIVIPGISRCNGMPVTDCDRSRSPYRGNIYINWSDTRNGTDDADIWFAKSTDGGDTWTPAKRVNDDGPGKQQFFTWMTVDQVTGKIWIIFYDRRNHPDIATDVYMAVSDDGGDTFVNFKVSDEPFIPDEYIFFGDYTNIAAVNDVVRPVWIRLHNNKLSLLTAIIDPLVIGSDLEDLSPLAEAQVVPNPFSSSTAFSFKLREPSTVTLMVNDMTGHKVADIINGQMLAPGKYIKVLETEGYKLKPGVYYFDLVVDQKHTTRKVVCTSY